jgi:hypothetical protein
MIDFQALWLVPQPSTVQPSPSTSASAHEYILLYAAWLCLGATERDPIRFFQSLVICACLPDVNIFWRWVQFRIPLTCQIPVDDRQLRNSVENPYKCKPLGPPSEAANIRCLWLKITYDLGSVISRFAVNLYFP